MYKILMLATSVALLPLVAQAQPVTPPSTLAEAWLAWQEQRQARDQAPFDWAYSFALRSDEAIELEQRKSRLSAELQALAPVVTAYRQPRTAKALERWNEALIQHLTLPARSAEPLGLPKLASDLRYNPAMSDITLLGTCAPPAWIEAWTLDGVERFDWQPGMTLDAALTALPATATRGIDHAVVISPTGEQHRRGIAPWNHQSMPLAPGARIVIQLPAQGLGGTREGDLINRELAAWLATRLPGEDCNHWEVE